MSADQAMFDRLYAHVIKNDVYALWQFATCRSGRPFPSLTQIREGVERGVRDNVRRRVRVLGSVGDGLDDARRKEAR